MSTLFSVAKFLGKSRREHSARRVASAASLTAEKDKDTPTLRSLATSKLSTVVVTADTALRQTPSPANTDVHIPGRHSPAPRSTRADSIDAVLSSDNESMLSFYGTPLVEEASVVPRPMRGGDGKDEAADEPGYAMVSPPKVVASEEWTQLDISHKADETAEAVSAAVQQERERGTAELEAAAKKYGEELKNVIEERKRVAVELEAAARKYAEDLKNVREERKRATAELEAARRKHEEELRSVAQERQSAAADLEAATQRHEEELQHVVEARDRAQEHARGAEAELRIAQDELLIKARAITGLVDEVSHLSEQIDLVEAQKMQLQVDLERAQFSNATETDRLQGVISLERTQNQDRIAALSDQVAQLEGKIAEQDDRITQLEDTVSEGQEEAREVYAQNYELETQLLHYEERAAEAKSDDETKDIQIAMLENNNAHVAAQLVDVQNSLTAMERQNRMLIDQLRQQSSEMSAAKGLRRPPAALTTGRLTGVAGSNRLDSAVRVIKMLNDEIYQTAASMTDQLENISTGISARFVAGDERRTALAANLKSVLGTELVRSLARGASALSADDSTFLIQVQTALQGCLIASCMRIITSWYPTEWEYGTFLVAMFERIRGSGNVPLPASVVCG